MMRRIEIVSSSLAAVAGVIGFLALLSLMWGESESGEGGFIILLMTALTFLIAAGGIRHGRRDSLGGMTFLVIGVVLLTPLAMASAFSVGLFFLPAVVLGLIALVAAAIPDRGR